MVLQIGDLKLAQLTWYQFERHPVFLLNFDEVLIINFEMHCALKLLEY